MRNRFINNLKSIFEYDKNAILMTGDLGFGVLTDFIEKYSKQFFNAGIAEQNMMSMASGLSHCGKNVFVYSISNFDTLRCIEQIRNDCCYPNANVKIISVGAGMAYGALGMSHHTTEDIAMMRALPNMTIFSPASKKEVDLIAPFLKKKLGTCYIRLGKGGENEIHNGEIKNYNFGDPIVIDNKGKILLLSTGAISTETLEAKEILLQKGIQVAMATMPIIKPVNESAIINMLSRYEAVVTIEEHSVVGGLGGLIAELIATSDVSSRLYRMGMNETYTSIVGDRKYLLDYYGLGVDAIVNKVLELMK